MDLTNETYGQYFTDEMRGDESLKPYETMKGVELINSHKELSGQVKQATETQAQYEARLAKAVEPLPENATPGQQKEYQAKVRALNGVPEKATDYKLQLPEGVPADDPLLTAFVNKAHAEGMSAAQVQAGVNAFVEYATQAEQKARQTSDDALKLKWGSNYEPNVRKAFATLEAGYREIGLPIEEARGVIDTLRNNPAVVQVLFNLSRHYSEAQLTGQGSTSPPGTDTGKSAVDRLAERIAARGGTK